MARSGKHAWLFLRLLLLAVMPAAFQACLPDKCHDMTDMDRDEATACYASIRYASGRGGAHHVDGVVYSVAWIDHTWHEEQNILNWATDYHWKREVIVLEHVSNDPSLPTGADPVVYHARFDCEDEHHVLSSPTLYTRLEDSHGRKPVVGFSFSCEPYPDALESAADTVLEGLCYEDRLCPMGTLCFDAQIETECPPDGFVCADLVMDEPFDDFDGDGEGNCEDEDMDGDGLSNEEEEAGERTGYVTDPMNPDTDGDGVDDLTDILPLNGGCRSNLRFVDDFQEPLSEDWTVVTGTWIWDGSESLLSVDSTLRSVAWLEGEVFGDTGMEVRVRPESGASLGLIARAQSLSAEIPEDNRFYYLSLLPASDMVRLSAFDGEWSTIAEEGAEVDDARWYTLQLAMQGSTFSVFLDGVLLFEAADPTFSSGAVGIMTDGSSGAYDYVMVCE